MLVVKMSVGPGHSHLIRLWGKSNEDTPFLGGLSLDSAFTWLPSTFFCFSRIVTSLVLRASAFWMFALEGNSFTWPGQPFR